MRASAHILFVLLATVCASCHDQAHRSPSADCPSHDQHTAKLTLDAFTDTDIPDSLINTSCYYWEKTSHKGPLYILFLSDAGGRALFFVDHHPVLLPLADINTLSPADQLDWRTNDIRLYTDGYYILKLNTTTGTKIGEESAESFGKMKISIVGHSPICKELHGGCGS